MNYWSELSIQFANQLNYLDELFKVYPTIPEGIRDIDPKKWKAIEKAFKEDNGIELINTLLKLDHFPIKDSYVAYLKRDNTALVRNPNTVARIHSRLKELGMTDIYKICSEPKETNRQIGPLFRRWLQKETLGIPLRKYSDFIKTSENAILDCADAELMKFANTYLNYNGEKGLDFVARMNGKYIIGEAKFLTDYGGHQNSQFEDAKRLLVNSSVKAVKIAILDGVLYIKGNSKMYNYIAGNKANYNILSSLVLKEFLYQV